MSERDYFSDQPNPDVTRNGSPPDEDSLPPQPIPRAGLGIADQLGFSSAEYSSRASAPGEQPATEASAPTESAEDPPLATDDGAPDPATIPELAPLAETPSGTASTPLVSSRPLEAVLLDEFDAEADDAPNGRLAKVSHSGGGNGGGDEGGSDDFEGDDSFGGMAQDLFSHLAELRARILYSVIAVALASVVTWNYGNQISELLARPIRRTLDLHGVGSRLVTLDPTEGFYLYFQISLASAIILAAPFVLYQMWRFIEPALTRTERRFTVVLVPFSVALFVMGIVLGYMMSPIFFQFFLQFQPPGSTATFSYGKSIALLAKMLLVFGVCFQVPVITIFLNKIGLVSRNFLIEYWRHAVVVIFTVVAIITPTWDPLTLCVCATPPCVFYALSIWLVKWL